MLLCVPRATNAITLLARIHCRKGQIQSPVYQEMAVSLLAFESFTPLLAQRQGLA